MLNFLVVFLLFRSVVTESATSKHVIEYYSGLAKSLAMYFHCPCINFITESKFVESPILQNVIKEVSVSHLISTNVYNFSNYQYLQNMTYGLQCQNPLQVVFANMTVTKEALIKYTHNSLSVRYRSLSDGIWLIFLPSLDDTFVEDFFTNIRTLFHAQTLIANMNFNWTMEIKEVYRVTTDFPLRQPYFGSWSYKFGLKSSANPVLFARRTNLEGLVLKVACLKNEPFSFTKLDGDGNMKLSGYMGDIWNSLGERLNFKSDIEEFRRTSDVISDTMSVKDVGFAEVPLSQSDAYRGEISFSVPIFSTTLEVFYQHPGVSIDANAQFLPFSWDMWLAIIAWLVFAAIVLYIGCLLSDTKMDTAENLTMTASTLLVAGALCAQGSVKTPRSYSCRAIYIATFLITSVVIPSYSASLISYLTFLPTNDLFESLKEFYQMGTMTMMVDSGGMPNETMSFAEINYEQRLRLGERVIEDEYYLAQIYTRDIKYKRQPTSTKAGLGIACRNKKVALYSLGAAVEYAAITATREDRKCSLVKMPSSAGKVALVYIYPWKSHFRQFINHNLIILSNGGVLQRFSKKYWPSMAKSNQEYSPVGLTNVFMVFVVLALGAAISIILFLIEYRIGRRKQVERLLGTDGRRPRFEKELQIKSVPKYSGLLYLY